MTARTPSELRPVCIALRVIALIAIVLAATWATHLIRDALNLTMIPASEQQLHRMIMLAAFAYIGLLALPFVPGAEIGIAMLTTFGPAIAPLVYTSAGRGAASDRGLALRHRYVALALALNLPGNAVIEEAAASC